MKQFFGNSGEFSVTDVKIMRKGVKSRQFGFVGFKSERHAKSAMKFFNNSYIDTSKIEMDYAKQQGDETIPRAWSRHTEGTSAFKITHKDSDKGKRESK
jgi:multiple RNA-binding domain-containing protein 1